MRKAIVTLLHCFIALVLCTYCLVPSAVFAANVGFAPSTGIWFSPTTFASGDTVRVYAVIINNDFNALDGVVTFYDGATAINSAVITGLAKDDTMQVSVQWRPTAGAHSLSARFTKAVSVDSSGNRQEVPLATINSSAGAPLSIGGTAVAPVSNPSMTIGAATVSASATTSVAGALGSIGSVLIQVAQEGKNMALRAITPTSSSAEAVSSGAADGADPFSKNREILTKANDLASTITSTAGKINDAYVVGKDAVDKGQSFYKQAQDVWAKVDPYWQMVQPAWDSISHHNDPKQIVIIAGVVIVFYWILRLILRRRRRRFSRWDE